MTEFSETLESFARKARYWRLSGDHHHGRDAEFPLVGYCFDNAYVLWELLNQEGVPARVIEGTTERVADELIVDGLDPREFEGVTDLAGCVHYWVEADAPGGTTYYVDVASDSFETLGKVLVTDSLPGDYIELSDSRAEGRETLETVREEAVRCAYCGGHRYDHGGCPSCYGTLSADLRAEGGD